MATATGSARGREARGSTRARLDRESIIAAGLELAASGTSSISVRELGTHLGADPTAIYRHFRSKEHLMQALLDELSSRTVAAVTADRADWRERLRQLAQATLALYVEYPAVGAEAVVLTTHGPGELDAIELMLEAFSSAGLSGDDVVRHYALLASHVLSSAAGIARAHGQRAAPGEASPWFDGPILADPRKYPLIHAFNTQIADLEDRELFTMGVESIIQSAEQGAARDSA
ncbi:TetR/AcrR family transcriptional regulator [Agromyces humatus]|uniref:TetR/AcrR family transcriptional regulator n=1 Tax=Agromyces humatus TaxID=279573 RepID=A0ABN2KC00_9MICO|nr:TetR/AcrR family transcriptional regulator [Agromyces humatus]